MSPPARILFDVTYTRTQQGNVGITRTVRRLLDALQAAAREGGPPCLPVAFHSSGFRFAKAAPQDQPARAPDQRLPARLLRWLSGGWVRRVISACIPLPLLRTLWTVHGRWTFDTLSAAEPPVPFRAGDVLLLADESWTYDVARAAHAARRQGARVVLVAYDLIPLRTPQFCAPLFTDVFERWLHALLATSDQVICISKATCDDLTRYAQERGLPLPPATHFRLGSDLPVASTGTVRPLLRDFLASAAPCFATVGTIEPRKNHAWLLDTMESLWRTGSPARWVVAGRPHSSCASLVARMLAHPEQGRRLLTLLDASDAEVAALYQQCRTLVLPSLAEGFGLPLVEARVRGCPVIASGLPAFAELADAGVALFPPGDRDALAGLLQTQAATPGRDSAPAMPPFTWTNSAQALLQAMATGAGRSWKT